MLHRWMISLAMSACLLILICATAAAHPTREPFSKAELAPIVEAMAAEGHPRDYLDKVFHATGLRKLDAVVSFNAMNKESTRDYSGFLSSHALRIARRFRARYRTLLSNAEKAYGVPREIIVALLQVETQFGRARQRFRILEVFTTLAVESGPDAVERHFQRLKPLYPELERDHLRERLELKQAFALEQLSALIRIGLEKGARIERLRGSYAGAFGMPQFLPSSYLRWAADGNSDNAISLNNVPDAVYSVAAYLKAHGWSGDADEEQRRRAVWEYNHSPEYVEALFAISRAITPQKRTVKGTANDTVNGTAPGK